MEIEFPIEFIVSGTPLSLQASGRGRTAWKEKVRQASLTTLPQPHFASEGRLAVILYYFPDTTMQGDIDNIVKPILDALCQHIYIDDHQVDRIVVQKFEFERINDIQSWSLTLTEAIEGDKPLIYIRLSNDLDERLG